MKKRTKILIYIAAIFAVGTALSLFCIGVGRDMFAFGKTGEEATVIIPDGATAKDVARIYKSAGLIKYPAIYRLYSYLRGDGGEYVPGEYTLSGTMCYDELRGALKAVKGARKQIKLTFPEGCSVDDIIEIFTAAGIGTREKFTEVINDFDFGLDFISEISGDGRIYRLEGYLFPDTYYFYSDSSETEAIYKMLLNFDVRVTETLKNQARERGYTLDELITLASIVEREAYYKKDMPAIASVFDNRLKSAEYRFLESDATAVYARDVGKRHGGAPTVDDLKIVSPYNTYVSEGLPPGAICSPGLDAIEAAAEPTGTDYYYFVCKKDKSAVFSRTYAEHLCAVEAAKDD